jgi:hypothetical protein
LGGAHSNEQVGFAAFTEQALPALCRVQRDDVIARFDARHAFTDLDDNSGSLVPEHSRKRSFRNVP